MGDTELLKEQIKSLTEKITFLETRIQTDQVDQKELIKQALSEFTNQQKKDPLKTEFLRKFNRSKKSLIKQKISDTIKIKPMLLADLKYYVVDQLKYCAKASFYRYIEEMSDDLNIKEGMVYPTIQVVTNQ